MQNRTHPYEVRISKNFPLRDHSEPKTPSSLYKISIKNAPKRRKFWGSEKPCKQQTVKKCTDVGRNSTVGRNSNPPRSLRAKVRTRNTSWVTTPLTGKCQQFLSYIVTTTRSRVSRGPRSGSVSLLLILNGFDLIPVLGRYRGSAINAQSSEGFFSKPSEIWAHRSIIKTQQQK